MSKTNELRPGARMLAAFVVEAVELPGDGLAHVREMSGAHAREFQRRVREARELSKTDAERAADLSDELQTDVILWCACDVAGALLFDADERELVAAMPRSAWNAVANAAVDVSGLGRTAVEEAEGNSDRSQTSDSGTDSP